MKTDGQIDEIKSRIDIHDLIAEYVDLKRSGSNFKGLCPFHSEKTPSFMVSPSKQIFHCFGCNKGGDIFSFIMNYENMTFSEALSHLANKAGVKIEEARHSDPDRGLKDSLYAINEEAMRFFIKNLPGSRQALTYLKERDITDETVSQFSLGYARGERDELMRHLRAVGYSDALLKSSGLVHFGTEGTHDFFRERLIFPIFDLRGKVAAFGGRTLSSSKNIPKYLNSPESPVFKKGESCYALNLARNTITQKGYAVIVEGYFDAIVCHQFGFTNTIAPLGTALTPGHLRKLKKLSGKVLLTFDADSAGIAAAKRSVELVYAEGMISKIVLLSEGDDPDTFLRKHGADHFRKILGKAISPVQFFLSRAGKNKIEGLRQFLSMLSNCPDTLLRDEAIRELSDLASEKVLRDELAIISRKNAGRTRDHGLAGTQNSNAEPSAEISREEDILLNISLSNPRLAKRIAESIDIASLESPLSKKIFVRIQSLPSDAELTQEKMLADCSPSERTAINKSAIEPGIDMERIAQNINECLKKICLKSVAARIAEAKSSGDENALHALLLEKKKLMQKRVELFSPKDSK
jgi:DNA primase